MNGAPSSPVPAPRSAPDSRQLLFAEYVRELFSFVCGPADTRIEIAAEAERLNRLSEADRAPEPAVPVVAPGPVSSASVLEEQAGSGVPADAGLTEPGVMVRRAAVVGLGSVAAAWPPERGESLDGVLRLAESTCIVWGVPADPDSEVGRARAAVGDRVDAAVRLASATMYSSARACGVPEEALDRGGAEFAAFLGSNLFGEPARVFAVQRQAIIDAEHQLSGRPGRTARVRCVAFGVRDESGGICSKAVVEADTSAGGAG